MLCESCGHNEATVAFKAEINGKTAKMNFCEPCAKDKGIFAGLGGITGAPHFGIGLAELIAGLAQDSQEELAKSFRTPVKSPRTKCEYCGTSFTAFKSTGFVGRDECYESFYPAMKETIRRIHGVAVHKQS